MAKLKWSRYIPHDPFPKQLQALKSDAKELLFGGALGGGKSDYLLMCCMQNMDIPGYAAIIFRKTLTDLKLPGALLDRAKEWLGPWLKNRANPNGPVTWVPGEHTYYFKTYNADGSPGASAQLVFGYMSELDVETRYQSAEFQTVCFDEISHWETAYEYKYMRTRLRKTVCSVHGKDKKGQANYVEGCQECDVKKASPTRLRAATNPGGKGGLWLKKRYQIVPDPNLYPDKREALKAISNGVRVPFVGTHPERKFVPSLIEDNPALDLIEYQDHLDELDSYTRSQLRDGNWEARIDSRFDREDARYYRLYDNAVELGGTMLPFSYFRKIFMTCDPAGTSREGVVDQQVRRGTAESWTVICTWGVNANNDLFLLHMKRFRDEIPVIVDEIARIYGIYHPRYVKMECNGLGLGVAQYCLKLGIPIKKVFKGTDKLENSTASQLLVKAGKVWLPDNAVFIEEFEDEIFSWTGLPSEQDDIVDNLSDAAAEVGPLLDALPDESSRNLRGTIHINQRKLIHSPSLGFNSPLGKLQRYHGVRQENPAKIRSETF